MSKIEELLTECRELLKEYENLFFSGWHLPMNVYFHLRKVEINLQECLEQSKDQQESAYKLHQSYLRTLRRK